MNNFDSYRKTNKKFHDVCDNTLAALNVILDQSFYPEILSAMSNGDASLELRKRVMLRSIDEKWIRAIEDVIPSIEHLTKDTKRYIRSNKESSETQQKSKPAKILDGFARRIDLFSESASETAVSSNGNETVDEDALMTYENRFVNALIQKLWAFVSIRYDIVRHYPQDSTAVSLKFNDEFNHGTTKAKINFSIELQQPITNDFDRTRAYGTDLWRRLQKLYTICQRFSVCEFARIMGNATVNSPITQTNAIAKNKNLRECLALWDFLELYENTGCSMIVNEHLEDIDEEYLRTIYSSMAMEYMVFRDKIESAFDEEKTVATNSQELKFTPQIVKDLVPANIEGFNMNNGVRLPNPSAGRELTELDHRILSAIDDVIAAPHNSRLNSINSLRPVFHRSYISKLIQSSYLLKDVYSQLKNAFLSRKGVESRVTWSAEEFVIGNDRCALLEINGKTILLYLNLEPSKYEASDYKYKNLSDCIDYQKTPMMLRVSDKRDLSSAIDLIGEMFSNKKVKSDPKYIIKDFRINFKTDNQLISEGLIKVDSGVAIDGAVECDDVINWIPAIPIETRTRKASHSYSAKLIQSDEETKSFACAMKDTFLAYKGVKARVSFSYEAFNKGRLKLGKITVRGKTLFLALALDPSQYDVEKYHHIDMGKDKNVEFPFGLKIRSKRAARLACELIEELMANNEIAKGGDILPTQIPPYETDEQLIERGLIKVSENGGRIPCNEQYSYSFSAAMMLASDSVIAWYSKVKNALLAYKDVSVKMGEYYETFTKDDFVIARFAVKDERLVCFLAIEQNALNSLTCPSYTFEKTKFLENTPTVICITSDFIADSLCKIIQTQFAAINKLLPDEGRQAEEFSFEHKDELELIEQGLVRSKLIPGERLVFNDIPGDYEDDGDDDVYNAEVDRYHEPATEAVSDDRVDAIRDELPHETEADKLISEIRREAAGSIEPEDISEVASEQHIPSEAKIFNEVPLDISLGDDRKYADNESGVKDEKSEPFRNATGKLTEETINPSTKMTIEIPTVDDIVRETEVKKRGAHRVYEYPDVSLFPEAKKRSGKEVVNRAISKVKSIFSKPEKAEKKDAEKPPKSVRIKEKPVKPVEMKEKPLPKVKKERNSRRKEAVGEAVGKVKVFFADTAEAAKNGSKKAVGNTKAFLGKTAEAAKKNSAKAAEQVKALLSKPEKAEKKDAEKPPKSVRIKEKPVKPVEMKEKPLPKVKKERNSRRKEAVSEAVVKVKAFFADTAEATKTGSKKAFGNTKAFLGKTAEAAKKNSAKAAEHIKALLSKPEKVEKKNAARLPKHLKIKEKPAKPPKIKKKPVTKVKNERSGRRKEAVGEAVVKVKAFFADTAKATKNGSKKAVGTTKAFLGKTAEAAKKNSAKAAKRTNAFIVKTSEAAKKGSKKAAMKAKAFLGDAKKVGAEGGKKVIGQLNSLIAKTKEKNK